MSAVAFDLRGVAVDYGATSALRPLDLRIEDGEAVALVGPSGAGKTTLLRVLTGLVRPTHGTVRILGRPLTELRGQRRDLPRLVGMMQQRLDLVPQLTVKHNVQAGALGRWGVLRSLAALTLPVEHPPAREAVARVGIAEKFGQRVAALSGGEQQRVALARLLVQNPQALLADEPVSSLDPARADDLVTLLRHLARQERRTLVASLHAPDLARRHFDRIIGLREGTIAFDLPAGEVTDEVLAGVYRLLDPLDAGEPEARPRRGGPGRTAPTPTSPAGEALRRA